MTNNIAKLRKSRGWTMDRLAQEVGTDASTISKLEKGKTMLNADWMARLAKALETSQASLIEELPHIESSDILSDTTEVQASRRRIPILGTAAGSHLQGADTFGGDTINYVDAPPMLEGAVGVYGLYITGASMEPMFKHGGLVVASMHKPARIGDAVVLQEKIGDSQVIRATVGILQALSDTRVRLRKLNPDAMIDFPVRNVYAMHRLLDFTDILGG